MKQNALGVLRLVASITAAMCGTGLYGQTALVATPTAINVAYTIGGALPKALTVAAKAGTVTAAYTVAITPSTALWVTATPATGNLPVSGLSVRINPTGMSAGTYKASIQISSPAAPAPGVTAVSVPVTLTITQALADLTISPVSVSIAADANTPKATATASLTTSGGPVSYTATVTGATWLKVSDPNVSTAVASSAMSGIVLTGSPGKILLSVDATSIAPQTAAYVGKVTVVATGVIASKKTQTITVSLTMNPILPTISSLWPSTARVGTTNATITIQGANFYPGSIVKLTPLLPPGAATTANPTYVSPDGTVLQAAIPDALLTSTGTTDATINVTVANSALVSTAKVFTVSVAPVVQAVVNSASYALQAISPCELVTLWGTGIGPATEAWWSVDSSGNYVAPAGGTVVTIDSKNAAPLYVSPDQISVQAPCDATIGTGKAVSVAVGAAPAAVYPGGVAIAASSPAIFTLDGSGSGQAAALNQVSNLFTVNGASTPAKLGGYLSLYVTGEGAWASATLAGLNGKLVPMPPPASALPNMVTAVLPSPLTAPVVTIGTIPATVTYAGPLVGSIYGVLQINVTVPTSAPTGPAVPVTVTLGGNAAQSGVTVAIGK